MNNNFSSAEQQSQYISLNMSPCCYCSFEQILNQLHISINKKDCALQFNLDFPVFVR